MKILIAAGSSGGHIFPAIATALKLKEMDNLNEVFFVGSRKNLDSEIFKNEGYKHCSASLENKFLKDVVSSFFILRKVRPDVAVGFGGYVSFPVLIMAKMMGIPTLVHEQNFFPGLANRILSNFADKVAVSFSETNNFFIRRSRVFETGNPIRQNLVKVEQPKALERFGLNEKKFTMLVMGGSQGAHFINNAAVEMLKDVDKSRKAGIQVIHLCGIRDYWFVKEEYKSIGVENRVFAFFDRMGYAYSACDLVISRAGATSIAEFTFFGKPAVLIPYPTLKVHQLENGRQLEKAGAAILIEQANFSKGRFRKVILDLIDNRGRLKLMSEKALAFSKPDAADRLAMEILDAVK